MAEKARPGGNQIDGDQLKALIDRYVELENEATDIMMAAMREAKEGPRAGQKEIKEEAKELGFSKAVFSKFCKAAVALNNLAKPFEDFEDEDRDQAVRAAEAIGGEFGEWLMRSLGAPALN